ncbi:MAG: O-antigen ligase family protein, partial [Bacteroidota bacterium]
GLEDVKKKIPLMLLPLIFSTYPPLSKKLFKRVVSVFVVSVITATLVCFYILLGYTDKQILQPQQASVFISHIRFGLLISMSVFILGYFFITKKSVLHKVFIPILIIWLVMFLIMMESATGLICTIVVAVLLLFGFILKTKNVILKFSLMMLFFLGCFFTVKVFSFIIDKLNNVTAIDKEQLPLLTKNGNPYTHDTISQDIENGNYVWLFVCEKELAEEWNKKSPMHYYGKDLSGNEIKYTLIRFLSSKGLPKDAEGVNALSEKEVKGIEKGIPNVNFLGVFNPTARLQKIIWEINLYIKGGNPSGHSVVQRFEFWKAAIGIIKENSLFGVGTGDVRNAFDEQYKKMNSPLTKESRHRSHNQFLAIGTAFGIIGISWFLFSIFYPLLREKNFQDYFYITFFIIAFLSMLTEDTLETQAGATFFAFFNSFLLFCREKSEVRTES